MKKRAAAIILAVLCMASLFACAGNKESGGAGPAHSAPITIGVTSIVKNMDPTDSSVPWSLTSHGVSETLYTQNAEGTLVSRFVDSLTQKDALVWEMALKKGPRFSDGSEVDARAVAECMNAIMQNNQMATASAGTITFTPTDDYHLTLTTERETKVMPSVLCEWTNILFKDLGNGSYAFTGPYMVKNLDVGVSLEMTPNPYYDERAGERSDVTLLVFQDASSMQQAFQSGEIDMAFTVTPEAAQALESEGLMVKNIDAGYQYFGIVNLQKQPLDDPAVRKAVHLALDREAMVTALKGGRAATGLFAHYYSFAGACSADCRPDEAAALLDACGWTLNSDGVREKDGMPLELSLVTYPSRPDLTVLMQLAASDLNDLGIGVTTRIVDNIDAVGKAGDYDIMFYAQHTAPTGEPAYFLNQFLRTGQGKNTNGYHSDEVEGLLDRMGTLAPGEERDALAKQVQSIVLEDLPMLYLVDPQWHIAVSERLAGYQPYCGDYFVVNDSLGLE